jgi:hypothetical protein
VEPSATISISLGVQATIPDKITNRIVILNDICSIFIELKRFTGVNITKTRDMKSRIFFTLALILMITATSCQKIKDALTIKVDTEFQVTLPVTVGGELLKTAFYQFSSSETLDPAENETIQQYKDRIKGYELTGVTGTVSDLITTFTLADATLSVSTPSLSTEWSITDQVIENGTELTFSNDNGQWTTINSMLDSGEIITVTFSGHTDKPGIVYTLILLFKAQVEAGIIG